MPGEFIRRYSPDGGANHAGEFIRRYSPLRRANHYHTRYGVRVGVYVGNIVYNPDTNTGVALSIVVLLPSCP